MTADDLRAAIAADCPHRLDDYDRHLAGRQPTPADRVLWTIEHRISSAPALEAQLEQLDQQAEDCDDYPTAKGYLEQASQIRHDITQQVTKEMQP